MAWNEWVAVGIGCLAIALGLARIVWAVFARDRL